jgi:LuxR family maltose regulon positive regulatory protein
MPEREGSIPMSDHLPLIESLSERELEVLRLMADGLSNREIAERLIVALGTVKAHLHNVYGKLDVQGRTQAIARARELELL